jgi:nucleotide-binding universal stress UspA family protein
LGAYLAWHGIEVECRTPTSPSAHAAEALVGLCGEVEADLLVMGAYSHSRLRQLILGGVTRHMLRSAPLPCLMSH